MSWPHTDKFRTRVVPYNIKYLEEEQELELDAVTGSTMIRKMFVTNVQVWSHIN